jgi:hypothetical protein
MSRPTKRRGSLELHCNPDGRRDQITAVESVSMGRHILRIGRDGPEHQQLVALLSRHWP